MTLTLSQLFFGSLSCFYIDTVLPESDVWVRNDVKVISSQADCKSIFAIVRSKWDLNSPGPERALSDLAIEFDIPVLDFSDIRGRGRNGIIGKSVIRLTIGLENPSHSLNTDL